MIIGESKSTQGTALIDGQNVQHRIRSTRHLGYCPQENCSMDFLTVEDSLYLLARLRGVKAREYQIDRANNDCLVFIGSIFEELYS